MDKKLILAAALSGISIATSAHADNAKDSAQEFEKCYGIQKCKGFNGCSVSDSDIKAANEAFHNKYKNNQAYECGGSVEGPAKKGHLGWIYVAKDYCNKIEGGFTIVKDKNGKKIVSK